MGPPNLFATAFNAALANALVIPKDHGDGSVDHLSLLIFLFLTYL